MESPSLDTCGLQDGTLRSPGSVASAVSLTRLSRYMTYIQQAAGPTDHIAAAT